MTAGHEFERDEDGDIDLWAHTHGNDWHIGPDCRQALGIASRSPVRLARAKPGGDVPGQTDLLNEETA